MKAVAIIPRMETASNDFGRAAAIDAEAVGQPGQRRFRILVNGSGRNASLWMEKQQLAGIGEWFEETVKRLDREQPGTEPDEEPGPIAAIYEVEFTAGQIGLGYQEDAGLFALQCFDLQSGTDQPAFRCLVSRGQARVLSAKIASVVAAGRPICPLCSLPMEPEGHHCPRSNGHSAPVG
jgi:uncharacterized repeat protein (TIGR03847 family)